MTDPEPFRPLPLAGLFALDLPEPEYVVDDLLPLGAAALLTGREKSGKGLFAIDLVASVALGEPFLGRAVREGPAVYCAAEEHVRDVRQRIAARVGEERAAPLFVLPLDGSTGDRLRLDDPGQMGRLVGMVGDLSPVVVVLDTLRELHDKQEDSSDDMGPLLRPVRQLAHQFNVTVVMNHHQNRAGTFRGSTAIRAAFDLELALGRTDDNDDGGMPRGTLRVEGRYGPRQRLAIELGDGLRWHATAAGPSIVEPGLRERILAALTGSEGGRTANEVAAGIGAALKTVQNELSRLLKERPPAVVVAAGSGRKGDARRYRPAVEQTIIPGSRTPYGEPSSGNHRGPAAPVVPDPSGNNGNHAGDSPRGCVECGSPVPTAWRSLYCARHGGAAPEGMAGDDRYTR